MVQFSGLHFHLEVGRILIEELYAGDLSAWRARGEKDASLRKLSALTASSGVAISRSVLHRSMQIYALLQRIGEDWSYLGVSHFRVVFSLPDEQQESLLRRADRERWTVRRLEAAVRELREDTSSPPAFVTGISQVERLARQGDALLGELDQLESLPQETLQDLSRSLLEARQVFDSLQEHLDRVLDSR